MTTYDGPLESVLVVLRGKPRQSDICLAALAVLAENVKSGVYSGSEVASGLLEIIRSPGSSTDARDNAQSALIAASRHSSACKDALATIEIVATHGTRRTVSMQGVGTAILAAFEGLRVRMLMRRLHRWVDNGIEGNAAIRQSLIELRSVKSIEPLVRMMADADGYGGESCAGDVLGGLFRNARPVVERGVSQMGTSAFELLVKATDYEHTRVIAFVLLGMTRDARVIEHCVRALDNKNAANATKWGVIAALANVGDKRAASVLRGLVQDADSRTRQAAADALKKLGG